MVPVVEEKKQAMARLVCQQSLLVHTRYFFKEMYGRRFVVSKHHEQISNLIDRIIKGEVTKAIINIAPRYGKTELAVKNFISHGLSINPASKYIHLSYSDDLALDNSEGIKAIVEHESYQALFPEVVIKKDSRAKKKWYTTAGGGVYATSTGGQVTGFGAGQVDREEEDESEDELLNELDTMLAEIGINTEFGGALVIDDAVKPEDAESDIKRDRINGRWDSTFKSRVNSRRTPVVVIGQRVHNNDFVAYLLENEPGEWEVLSLPAIQEDEDGNEYALWPFKHTLDELKRMEDQDPIGFGRQMMQNPMPAGGLMYQLFRTYDQIPQSQRKARRNYTDTADEGSDYLCSIDYVETEMGMYLLDVLYSQKGMETTEAQMADMVWRDNIEHVKIESNNGGKGFSRNVEAKVRLMHNYRMRFEWFHQSQNKHARIFTNAPTVQNIIFYPEDWETRWPIFAKHIKSYMATGKNKHDDAPDALTGMVETFIRPAAVRRHR